MTLNDFLQRVKVGQMVDFQQTMSIITEHYHYRPTEFSNGLTEPLISQAGTNEGSCKIFAFARLQNLTPEQTLSLFGDYYHKDVLGNPDGSDHQNIRRFMRDGWKGIVFKSDALQAK